LFTNAADSVAEKHLNIVRALLSAELTNQKKYEFIAVASNHDGKLLASKAREVVAANPALIVATSLEVAKATKSLTSKIPVVFISAADPVNAGLILSFRNPGGNITGVFDYLELDPKLTQMASEAFPTKKYIVFVYQNDKDSLPNIPLIRSATLAPGQNLIFVGTQELSDLFVQLREQNLTKKIAVVMPMSPIFYKHHAEIIKFLNSESIPTMYERSSYVESGGLMSYGPVTNVIWKEVAKLSTKILSGQAPANLPVIRATDMELVINLKTARQINYVPSKRLLIKASRVFE
jgi:putative tryptophan/tyrosine transport system substrate-binding protein